jgi:chromosome segregation ATPase
MQPPLTPTDIEAAAERIAERGQRPTTRAVRAELGGGSMATIVPALAAWNARRPAPQAAAVSAELQRAVKAEVEGAVAAARAELTAQLADLHDACNALTEELRTQSAAAVAAEQRAAAAETEAERLRGAGAALERTLADAREQNAREREAAERARREVAEAAVRLEMLPGLQAELEALRGRLDTEREARVRAEIAAAELRGQIGKKG